MNKENVKPPQEKENSEEFDYHTSFNLSTLRHEHELFREEDNIKFKTINVKRINLPKKGENWEIFQNEKVVLVLNGTRFSKKEKEFLRTIDGMQFIINGFKSGWKSVVKFKSEMQSFI